MNLLQPMMIAALLSTGMGVALLGSVKVPLARRLAIDEARVGGLVSLFGFTMIPIILAAGYLTDLDKEVMVLCGSVLFAASFGLLASARAYPLSLAAVVVMSAAWSMLINVGNVLVPAAFPGTAAHSTNLANVFFGMGAFLTPLAVAFLVRRTSLPLTLWLLGGLALLPGLLALGVDFTAIVPPEASGQGTSTSLVDPVLLLCGFGLFFYGPLEASLGAWTTTYLGERGVREEPAAKLLSAFWLAYMASRLLTAFTLPAGGEAPLILVLAVACIGVLAGMVWGRGRVSAMVLVLAAGFVFGPIFPTLMAILLGHMAPSVHGRAVGVLFGIGGIGWTLIPMLIGAYARRTSVQRGFSIAVLAAVGLTAVAAALIMR